jgi:hypothetical protein
VRLRQLNGNPFGGWGTVIGTPHLVAQSIAVLERPSCRLGRAGARGARVVRRPVVRITRCGERNRIPGVVPPNARRAGRDPVRGGRHMRVAPERRRPARRTRPCSRPLRARDRSHFDSFRDALAAADGQAVGRVPIIAVPNEGCILCYTALVDLSRAYTGITGTMAHM